MLNDGINEFFQNGRQNFFCQFVGGDWYEGLERRLGGSTGEHPNFAEMITRTETEELDLPPQLNGRQRYHACADDEQRP